MKMRRWGFLLTAFLVFVGLPAEGTASAAQGPVMPGHLPWPAGGTVVVGDGINTTGSNAQLAETIPTLIRRSWQAEPPLCPQAGGSSAASISVSGDWTIVVDRQYQCSWLSAYETSTGKLKWRNPYHFAESAKIDGSRVYVVHDNQNSSFDLDALNLTTGGKLWSAAYASGYTTTFAAGLVLNGGRTFDAGTGTLRAAIHPYASGALSLLLDGGKIFNNADDRVEAFSASTGALLWTYIKPNSPFGPGFGTEEPSLHNGRLYIPSFYAETLVLDPATGHLIRLLPKTEKPIAFDGRVGIFTTTANNEPSDFRAVNLDTGETYWTHRLDMVNEFHAYKLVSSAPIIANGLVWILAGLDSGTPGQLIALDEVNGKVRSGTETACPAAVGNLALAQHRIFVPSGCGVLTFAPATGTDTTPPTIVKNMPAASSVNVAQAGEVTAGFSEVVTGVSTSTFTLKTPTGTAVPATVTYNATTRVATLKPTAALAADTKYTVGVRGGVTAIRDDANNPLSTVGWTFTTGPAPTAAPRTPTALAKGVNQAADITATFSEPVTGVSAATFTLKTTAGTPVAATVAYNPTTRTATLNPTATLSVDTNYTATLAGGSASIRDSANNTLATTEWTFTTGPSPTLTGRTPSANATSVSRTTDVTATFSEPVLGTGSYNHFVLRNATTNAMIPVDLFSYDPLKRTATLNPKGTLAPNTRFTVTLTKSLLTDGIVDMAGNPLGTQTWSFTTGP